MNEIWKKKNSNTSLVYRSILAASTEFKSLYPPLVQVRNNQAGKATVLMDIALMYHELS